MCLLSNDQLEQSMLQKRKKQFPNGGGALVGPGACSSGNFWNLHCSRAILVNFDTQVRG